MNVKEYANNDAKLYDNRVVTIEELTVVGRDGHLIEETKRGSTSPTVSSKCILSQYRDFVNRKYSISEENSSDTAYLAAIERSDMETAQKMVDEGLEVAVQIMRATIKERPESEAFSHFIQIRSL